MMSTCDSHMSPTFCRHVSATWHVMSFRGSWRHDMTSTFPAKLSRTVLWVLWRYYFAQNKFKRSNGLHSLSSQTCKWALRRISLRTTSAMCWSGWYWLRMQASEGAIVLRGQYSPSGEGRVLPMLWQTQFYHLFPHRQSIHYWFCVVDGHMMCVSWWKCTWNAFSHTLDI